MPKKPKAVKTGKTKEHKGTTVAEYDDGAWRYVGLDGSTKGAIAIRSKDWKTIPFTDEMRELAVVAQRDKRREAFQRGVVVGAKATSERPINTSDEAFEFLVEKRMEVALSGDAGSLGDAKWIDEALHGNRKQEVPTINIKIDNATLHAIQQVEERHIIEGEFVEQD